MPEIFENVGQIIATYKKDTSGFMAYFRIIEEVLQIIYRTFSSNK